MRKAGLEYTAVSENGGLRLHPCPDCRERMMFWVGTSLMTECQWCGEEFEYKDGIWTRL